MHLPILLLEDNIDVRDLLVEVLSDNDAFAVHAATTIGEAQALVAARGASFAAAVLDISLLDGDGRRFCAELRRQGFHQPVILLSDLSSEDDVVLGLEAGADDYLVKPFSIAELLARVAAKLRHAAPRAGLVPHSSAAAWASLLSLPRSSDLTDCCEMMPT